MQQSLTSQRGPEGINTITKEIATYIICFSLAVGVVNATGIFEPIDNVNVDTSMYTPETIDGVTELSNGSIMSDSDVSSALDGWSMLSSTFGIIKSMLSVIVLPGPYLIAHGVNTAFALALQIVINGAYIWSIMQYVLNRPAGNME